MTNAFQYRPQSDLGGEILAQPAPFLPGIRAGATAPSDFYTVEAAHFAAFSPIFANQQNKRHDGTTVAKGDLQ